MYAPLFHLRELPFRLSPDPEFLYLSREHARAKAYLESTIWFSDGFAVVTGEIGSGKTTLIETFLRELQKDVVCAQISQTQISEVEFLQTLLVQFGFQPFQMGKAELIAAINSFLIEQYANGRRVLLIVDEAQNLTLKVLEEIRLLSGVETTKEKVLRIILAGQPELNDKLNSPELVQLVQRIRLRFHLSALPATEVPHYIDHRLDVAGSKGRQIFDPASYPVIYKYTGGTPRLINTLCDTAMMSAFGARRDTVTMDDVTRSIEELKWKEHPSGKPEAKAAAALEEARKSPATVGRLLVAFGGRTQSQHELVIGRLGIGRTRDNDLRIKSRHISRHHAQIINEPDASVLEDLNSTNGVYFRSKRIRRRILNNGDVIQIGQHELIYIDDRRGAMGEATLHEPGSPADQADDQAQEHISTLVASEFPDQALRHRK
jgi:type II secretory pathway predicted ATPase ExeA